MFVFSSRFNSEPPLLTMRSDIGDLSFNDSFVEFTMASTFKADISPFLQFNQEFHCGEDVLLLPLKRTIVIPSSTAVFLGQSDEMVDEPPLDIF